MCIPKTIYVTYHALLQFQQRASLYADDGEDVLIAQVRAARLTASGEPMPIHRDERLWYFVSRTEPAVYFICEPCAQEDALRVITVLGPGQFVTKLSRESGVIFRGAKHGRWSNF